MWVRDRLAPSEGAALDLAVFRATIAFVIAMSSSVAVADHWAALPEGARVAPIGVGWLLPILPIEPASIRIARLVLWAACVTGLVGLFSRASFAIIALCLSYVLLAPQLGGSVFHDHHLVWFAVLLAASPCGDALSVDAMIARRRGRVLGSHGRAYGLSIRVAWILIGLVFFFPGVHKLAESGLAWITSDNLRNQLWWKWAQDPSIQPSWRIDRDPLTMRALAGLTVVFELVFLPLVFWRRTRALAVVSALVFHQATDYFMGVRFSVLFACYTVFVPWGALWQRFRKSDFVPSARSIAGPAIAASFLVLGVGAFGAAGITQGYPFACYPTFQWMAADRMPALRIEIERADGSRAVLDRELYAEPGPRGWALEWRLAGVYDRADPARIEAWWRQRSTIPALRGGLRDVVRVRFERVVISIDPDDRGRVLEARRIHTIDAR